MKRQAADALATLVGQLFWYIGRAVDLVWVGFGSLNRLRRPLGGSDVLAKFALHLQCPWRISTPHGILVGNSDHYTPASTSKKRGWKWDKARTSSMNASVRILRSVPNRWRLCDQSLRIVAVGSAWR